MRRMNEGVYTFYVYQRVPGQLQRILEIDKTGKERELFVRVERIISSARGTNRRETFSRAARQAALFGGPHSLDGFMVGQYPLRSAIVANPPKGREVLNDRHIRERIRWSGVGDWIHTE